MNEVTCNAGDYLKFISIKNGSGPDRGLVFYNVMNQSNFGSECLHSVSRTASHKIIFSGENLWKT